MSDPAYGGPQVRREPEVPAHLRTGRRRLRRRRLEGRAPQHPGWYQNLLAHPDVAIQVWDKVIPVTARTGTAADKARVWPIMTAQWPAYDEYQGKTQRDIPVVLLRPR